MLRCMKPGCPRECGTRMRPGCADRMLCHVLFLALSVVLAVSLAIGVARLREAARLTPVSETAPLARPQVVELVSEAQDHRGKRVAGDRHGDAALRADEAVEVPQQR